MNCTVIEQSGSARAVFWGEENILNFEEAWRAEGNRRNGKQIPPSCLEIKWLFYSEWGKFGNQIERLFSQVERDKVKVIIFEEFILKTKETYEEVLSFLEVPSDERSDFPLVNEGKGVRWPFLQQGLSVLINIGLIIRSKLNLNIKNYGFSRKLLSLNSKALTKNILSESFKSEFDDFFRPDIEKLSKVLNRNFAIWLKR